MQVTLSREQQSSPLRLFIVGIIVLLLGCIWPAFALGDFQDERDASSWERTDATVIALTIDVYEYECGDAESSSTCEQYTVNYHLRFIVNGTEINVLDSRDISYFDSRVWEVDYPEDSVREIAYNSENPSEIDVDPGNYAPFIGPIVVFGACSLLALLFISGAIKGLLKSGNEVVRTEEEDSTALPQSTDEISFVYSKNVWGVQTYQHPTVDALAKKLASFSCTDKQITAFFQACQKRRQSISRYEEKINLEWLNDINEMVEKHSSINKFNFSEKVKIARVAFIGLSVFFGVLSAIFVLPVFLHYHALPWYAWVPVWLAVAPIGLLLLSIKIVIEFEKFADQGLAELLMKYLEREPLVE